MPIARYDPPEAPKGGFLRNLRGVAQFYLSPLTTILGAATSRTPKDDRDAYYALPIEVDTETGRVSAIEMPAAKGKAGPVVAARNARAREAAAAIQRAYDDGAVSGRIPPGYRAIAEQVAQLPHDQVIAVTEDQAQDRTEFKQFDYGENDMAGFLPPGGIAGFMQMTGASKLALMKGQRRSKSSGSSRRRRARKAKGRPRKIGRPKRKAVARRKKGRARLVKGSAAAKRYMASIRRKRRA